MLLTVALAVLAGLQPGATDTPTLLEHRLRGTPLDMEPVDYDGDGDTDFLVATAGEDSAVLLENLDGLWTTRVVLRGLEHPSDLLLLQRGSELLCLLCDSRLDLVVETACIPGGPLQPIAKTRVNGSPQELAALRLGSDGSSVLAAIYDSGRVVDLRNRTAGEVLAMGGAKSLAAEDLDGDGRQDLAVSGCGSGLLVTRQTAGMLEVVFRSDFYDGIKRIAPADVDGDGLTDIVGLACAEGGVAWWRNPGGNGEWERDFLRRECPGPKCLFLLENGNDNPVLLVGSVAGDGLLVGGLNQGAWMPTRVWREPVTAVAAFFNPSGSMIVAAGSLDGLVRILELSRPAVEY